MKNLAQPHTNLLVLTLLITANGSACVALNRSTLRSPAIAHVEETTALTVEPNQLIEQALEVAATAEDPDAVVSQIALMLAEAGQYEQALTLTAAIQASDIRSSGLSQIGLLLGEAGRSQASADAFRTALQGIEATVVNNESIPPDQILDMVTMAERAITAGHPDIAWQMLELAIGAANSVGSDASLADEKAAIAAQLIALEDFDRALQMAQSMAPSVPRVEILTQAAIKLASIGQLERADQLLTEATDLGQSLTDGYMSNGSCYIAKSDALSHVVQAMAAIQKIQTAALVAAAIEDCAPASDGYDNARGDAYVEVIQQASTLSEVNAVLEALPETAIAQAETRQLSEGDALTQNRAFMAMAIKLAELGEIERSIEMANTVQSISVRGLEWTPRDPLLELITALLEQGALEQATQMAERLQRFEPASIDGNSIKQELTAQLAIAIALDASGQSESADRLFNRVVEQVSVPRTTSGSAPLEQQEQADRLIETSEKLRLANRPELADELLDQAYETAQLILARLREDYLPENPIGVRDISSILQVGHSLHKQGRDEQAQTLHDAAFTLTQRFFAQGAIASDETATDFERRSRMRARLTATAAFVDANQPQMASQLVQALVPQLQDRVYHSDSSIGEAAYDVVAKLAAAGQPQVALALTTIPIAPEIRAAMLVAIAVSL